jgi:hypothetical protein
MKAGAKPTTPMWERTQALGKPERELLLAAAQGDVASLQSLLDTADIQVSRGKKNGSSRELPLAGTVGRVDFD